MGAQAARFRSSELSKERQQEENGVRASKVVRAVGGFTRGVVILGVEVMAVVEVVQRLRITKRPPVTSKAWVGCHPRVSSTS